MGGGGGKRSVRFVYNSINLLNTISHDQLRVALFLFQISENSSTEWKYEMFWMLEEYKKKTFLPPPISIFERILQILKYLS